MSDSRCGGLDYRSALGSAVFWKYEDFESCGRCVSVIDVFPEGSSHDQQRLCRWSAYSAFSFPKQRVLCLSEVLVTSVERVKDVARRIPIIYPGLRKLRRRWRGAHHSALQAYIARWPLELRSANHSLPAELIVSLTSYPARFNTLHLTLISILRQTTRPDRLILWIAHDDMPLLPEAVSRLTQYGLEIRACVDLRSYKKIIPTLEAFPDAFIVTADDDIHYHRNWLYELVDSYMQKPADVICQRGHCVRLDQTGNPLSYLDWSWNITEELESPLVAATGVGGVLYRPGVFDNRAVDASLFLSVCPTADDLWLYWMIRLKGASVRVLRGNMRLITWQGSQETALSQVNTGNDALNDKAVRALVDYFGFPV